MSGIFAPCRKPDPEPHGPHAGQVLILCWRREEKALSRAALPPDWLDNERRAETNIYGNGGVLFCRGARMRHVSAHCFRTLITHRRRARTLKKKAKKKLLGEPPPLTLWRRLCKFPAFSTLSSGSSPLLADNNCWRAAYNKHLSKTPRAHRTWEIAARRTFLNLRRETALWQTLYCPRNANAQLIYESKFLLRLQRFNKLC